VRPSVLATDNDDDDDAHDVADREGEGADGRPSRVARRRLAETAAVRAVVARYLWQLRHHQVTPLSPSFRPQSSIYSQFDLCLKTARSRRRLVR
jgi:hypothetical protein